MYFAKFFIRNFAYCEFILFEIFVYGKKNCKYFLRFFLLAMNVNTKSEKKNRRNILEIFLYLKKKSIEIRLIFEKKNRKNFENNFCNFFIFEKKSRLIVG